MLLFPNAKINIGLNVVEKRPDGYHNIETIFYPIALRDELEVSLLQGTDFRKADYSMEVRGIKVTEDPEKNLVIKALQMLRKDFNLPPVAVRLRKNIPFGAGLGGGSSDAAFMLKALNELCALGLSDDSLESYAIGLGADCPFFIRNRPVFASGIGNEFTPAAVFLTGYSLVLIKPDIHVSTPEAYASIVPGYSERKITESIKEPVEKWKFLIYNDFEPVVFKKYPVVSEIKATLYDLGAVYASMSGSGSSVYGIFKEIPDKLKIFDKYFVFVESF